MSSEHSLQGGGPPLTGCRVMEHSRTVAAAYAGRLLAAMGATVVMIEPLKGSPLRTAPPLLDGAGHSALFAFLSAGKRSLTCDLLSPKGQRVLAIGRLQISHFQRKDGTQGTGFDVWADEVQNVSGRPAS